MLYEVITIELEYENIRIRQCLLSDAEQLAEWWNSGTVMKHAGFPNGLGITPEKIRGQIAAESDHTVRRYMICIDEKPVGEMVHRQVSSLVCEIGIKICEPDMQNLGYGKKILSLFISGLFEFFTYEVIQLDTDLENLRAQHVYESLGFQKLGVNYNCWSDQLGNLRSAVEYQLTQDSFISFV